MNGFSLPKRVRLSNKIIQWLINIQATAFASGNFLIILI